MLREMIKRSVFNWKMVVACGLGIALLYHEMIFGWVNLRGIIFESDYYSGLEDFLMLFAWSSYIIYAGIFPGLSYGFSFLEERKSGYLQMIRQRISVTKYVWYKVIAVGISGGVCTGITFLVSVGPIQFFTRNSSVVALQNKDTVPADYPHNPHHTEAYTQIPLDSELTEIPVHIPQNTVQTQYICFLPAARSAVQPQPIILQKAPSV